MLALLQPHSAIAQHARLTSWPCSALQSPHRFAPPLLGSPHTRSCHSRVGRWLKALPARGRRAGRCSPAVARAVARRRQPSLTAAALTGRAA